MKRKSLNQLLTVALIGIGLVFLMVWGFKFWNSYVVPSYAQLPTAGITFWLGFAFLAGIVSFFAPCSFSMFPAYIAFWLGSSKEKDHRPEVSPVKLGFLAALGVLVFFIVLSAILLFTGKAIVPYLFYIAPAVGIIILLAGILMVAGATFKTGFLQKILKKFKTKKEQSGRNIFLFGIGYGGASLGCTLPLLLVLVVKPLSEGKIGLVISSFLVYGLAMSLLMIIVTYIVHKQQHVLVEKLSASTVWIKRISGIILILVGLYLIYYNLSFSMLR